MPPSLSHSQPKISRDLRNFVVGYRGLDMADILFQLDGKLVLLVPDQKKTTTTTITTAWHKE